MIESLDERIVIDLASCEPTDRVMVSLEEHAYALGQRLREPGMWNVACEWLEVAAGLGRVDVDLAAYDRSLFMCGSASRYYDARSGVAGLIVTEMTRFIFLWGGLEAYVGELPKGAPKVPEIRRLLRRNVQRRPRRPAHFACTAAELRHFIVASESYRHLAAHFNATHYESDPGVVIAAVAKLRNDLLHGNLTIPESRAWGGRPRVDLSAIRCAGRIVLMVIQMLAAADAFAGGDIADHRDYADDTIESQLYEIIDEVHLEPIEYYFDMGYLHATAVSIADERDHGHVPIT
jgi:hypothetical protein